MNLVEAKVDKILRKQVVGKRHRERNDYLSNVFTRNKDGGKCMILNLKQFNTNITYHHLKMEPINQVIAIIRPNVYMASTDLKDAFYSNPAHPEYQKYLRFVFLTKIYQYTCMSNGYGPAMQVFTKVSKIPFPHLRSKGLISVGIC